MEAVYYCIKVQLPAYLKSLPLPKSFAGFAVLTGPQWLQLVPFFIFSFIFLCILLSPILRPLFKRNGKSSPLHINEMIKKNEKKVVDTFDIEDIGDKKSFCRCWKSLTFPYCDGAHKQYNKETGDNIGPLKIKATTEEMEAVYHYFKVQLPGYFKSLPLPKSFGGFATLTRSQWLQLLPFLIFVFIFFYLLVSPFLGVLFKGKKPRPHVNKKIKKNEKKVVHTFDIEDIGDKKAFCRCWKSSEFPYCDGTHNKHNQETGDNVGPLVIKKKVEE